MTDVFAQIERIAGVAARKDELLSLHTSYGVGGPCDLMLWVSTESALIEVMQLSRSRSLPAMVLGNGSNVLVRDGGISGLVIRLVDDFSGIETREENMYAGGGAQLGDLVSAAASAGLGGLEFLAGIPGTVGGAVVTNAGSCDVWVSQRLVRLRMLNEDLKDLELEAGDIGFGYRRSGIGSDSVITRAVLAGYSCPVQEIRRKLEENLDLRKRTQPTGGRSAGCVFRNPPGDSAGRIIEKAGLKGFKIGGAQVSPIHANWIVNTGGATAREILDLIDEIRATVKTLSGIDLDLEISVVGRD